MKNYTRFGVSVFFMLITGAGSSQASFGSAINSNANYLGFNAPIVHGDQTTTDNPVGTIVYDLNTHGFRGLFEDGNWGSLTQGSFKAPTMTKFTSASGSYTPPTGVLYIRVRMVGGGGGGAGSGTSSQGAGTSGGSTTFGTSLLVASGGNGASAGGTGGTAGGSASLGTITSGYTLNGGTGGGSAFSSTASVTVPGGLGGSSVFGGGGAPAGQTGGNAGTTNTGGGGAGAGSNGVVNSYAGAGGGAGGFVEAIIPSPVGPYSYCIGNSGSGCTGGTGGSAGTSGQPGGAGGSGFIEITEYYQ